MKTKVRERNAAVRLRKKGLSYNEILKEVAVSKSTLSSWLKDLPLTWSEKRYLRSRRDANISRGRIKAATANRARRLNREAELFKEAKTEFKRFVKDPLFQVGIALYWAEGAKRSDMFQFSNSDPQMVVLMLLWIKRFFGIEKDSVFARLYMHRPYAHENWEKYWARELSVPERNFRKTIYKPTGLLIKKRPNYKGCLRLELPKSTNLRRKTIMWSNLLVEHYKHNG
ncbi:MAG: hypothetical protein ISR99_00320 [Parcubacteria group bacterium]|nr:hypothetical protein [Parcubacteria group bacterium]